MTRPADELVCCIPTADDVLLLEMVAALQPDCCVDLDEGALQ